MTNEQLSNLLKQVGLEHGEIKSLPEQTPTNDIVEQIQTEQGLNVLANTKKTNPKEWLSRKTNAQALFNNKPIQITFTYKKVKGAEVNDLDNAEKQRYAVYIDEKFYTGVYFTHLGAVKQFEYLLKYNAELFTNANYSAFHIGENWKLPTRFQTDIGRNKCLTWTSNSGVPLLIPTIIMCQNYDNSNDLGGTPFSRPNYIMQKSAVANQVQVGLVHKTDIPVIDAGRWSVISQALNDNQQPTATNDELAFINWYMQLVAKANK